MSTCQIRTQRTPNAKTSQNLIEIHSHNLTASVSHRQGVSSPNLLLGKSSVSQNIILKAMRSNGLTVIRSVRLQITQIFLNLVPNPYWKMRPELLPLYQTHPPNLNFGKMIDINTLLYCQWEYKLLQPLQKTVQRFPKKIKNRNTICFTSRHISKGNKIPISNKYGHSHAH